MPDPTLYRFASDASFAALDATADSDLVEVVWRTGRLARVSMDLASRMVEGLRSLPTVFDAATFRRSLGDDHAADLVLRHLKRRGLIEALGRPQSHVRIEGPAGRKLADWRLDTGGRARAVDLLVGDDVTLAATFGAFAVSRPRGRLVGWIRLGPGEVEVCPLTAPRAASPFVARRRPRSEIPAGAVEARFAEVSGALRSLLRRVLHAKKPPAGTAHLEMDWSVAPCVWQVTSSYDAIPAGAIALAYAEASIQDRVDGWGITPDAFASATIARAEALERFALRRRDLARRAPEAARLTSLAGARGLAFDYYRALSRGAASHALCVARPEHRQGKPHAVPLDWIYFGPSPGIVNSNGAAFGPTLAAAIGSGRREIVERDLVIRAWYGLRPSRELLEREIASPRIERWRNAARDRGLDVHWFLLGDWAPGSCERTTVYCVLASQRPPYISTGSATRPDLVAAVEKAFFEAAGCHLFYLQRIAAVGPRAFVRRALKRLSGDPRTMMLQHYGEYWAARKDAFAAIVARLCRPRGSAGRPLDKRGFYFVDVTPPLFGTGVVVKVLHPHAAPLPTCRAHLRVLERLLGVPEDEAPPAIA